MTADLSDLGELWSQAVTQVLLRRVAGLANFAAMIAPHGIELDVDCDRLVSDRLYAALRFQAQSRIAAAMKCLVDRAITLAQFRETAMAVVANPTLRHRAFVDRDNLGVLLSRGAAPEPADASTVKQCIATTGMISDLEIGTGLVILQDRIHQDQSVNNHSDEFHLFTVNVDVVVDNPIKTVEAMVHENGHNVFNCFLEDRGITLADHPLSWYSPWTNSLRHHRGVVHGFMVFSMVTRFYQQLQAPEHQASIDRYIALQKEHLKTALRSVDEILPNYPGELGDVVRHVYGQIS